jgi:hypothetical protein
MIKFMGAADLVDGVIPASIDFINNKPYDRALHILVGRAFYTVFDLAAKGFQRISYHRQKDQYLLAVRG